MTCDQKMEKLGEKFAGKEENQCLFINPSSVLVFLKVSQAESKLNVQRKWNGGAKLRNYGRKENYSG